MTRDAIRAAISQVVSQLGYFGNMLLGPKDSETSVYIIDFGIARRYKNPRNGAHMPFLDGKPLIWHRSLRESQYSFRNRSVVEVLEVLVLLIK
jgi:hypothetical protein